MTNKYDRVLKVIKKTLGEDFDNLDHGNLVHLCYAVLEEFETDEEKRWARRGANATSNIYGEETRGGRLF